MNDPDCLAFLGGKKGVADFLNQYGAHIGHANFLQSTANAASNIGMVNGTLFQTLINNTGSFYEDKGVSANPGMSFDIKGGGSRAREFILLHEIAHGFSDYTHFVPDAGNDTAQKANNALLEQNCAKTLGKQ